MCSSRLKFPIISDEEEDGWLVVAGLRERSWLLDGVAMMASLGDQPGPEPSLARCQSLQLPSQMGV